MKRKSEIPESVKIVGQNIKEIITQKNLKMMDVAYKCDLETSNLRKLILGQQVMGINVIIRIQKALDVTFEELFKGV